MPHRDEGEKVFGGAVMDVLELRRPHGFLLWRGKKAAVLDPGDLPVGTELEVATGGERFGTVVLGDPARMLASEADRKEYFERHRVWPKERAAWWPGETKFNVYPVESFEPYGQIRRAWALKEAGEGEPDCPMCVNEGGGWCRLHDEVVKAGKSCDDWQPFKDWRCSDEVVKEAGVMPYEKYETDDKWCVRKEGESEPLHCYEGDGAEGKADRYLRALYANVEDAGKGVNPLEFEAEEAPLTETELKEAASEFEKFQVTDEKAEELETDEAEVVREEEPCACESCECEEEKEISEISDAKAAPKKTVDGTEYPASAFLVVEDEGKPSTWHLRVRDADGNLDHRLMGGAWAALHGGYRGNVYEGPGKADALKKLKELYESEGMDTPGEKEAEADKAGRRLKKTMKDRLRDAYQTIKEMLTWADYDEEEPPTMLERMKVSDAGLLLKSVNGEPWIVTWSSNAFVDRDDEMFSTAGLERYVRAAEQKQDRGHFNFWHVPGTDFAEKSWQGVIGRFLVEAGPFLDTPRGQAARKFFTGNPDGHPEIAPEGWGCSVEYRYLPEQKKEKVYEDFWVTRTSVLPRLAAANTRTRGGVTMALTDQQRKALTEIFPDEAESLIAETEAKTKELEEAGVEFKALSPEKAAAALRKLAGDTEDESLKGKLEELAKAMWEDEPEESEDEEDMDEEEKAQERGAEIDVEALAAEMVKHFDVQLAPLQELQERAERQAAEIAELRAALKANQKAEERRKEAELPRMVLSLEKRASQADETALAAEDPLMKAKPEEPKTPDGSGAQHFFGKK